MKKSIFLTGFMGSGKTTVGRLLADQLNCAFVDLDELLIERQERSIADIFAAEGEQFFRDCETQLLNELNPEPATVYATGGGLVLRAENRARMRQLGVVVYLQTDWQILKQRLQKSSQRPLVNSARTLDDLQALLVQRQAVYEDADIIVATGKLQPLAVAGKIAALLPSL